MVSSWDERSWLFKVLDDNFEWDNEIKPQLFTYWSAQFYEKKKKEKEIVYELNFLLSSNSILAIRALTAQGTIQNIYFFFISLHYHSRVVSVVSKTKENTSVWFYLSNK